MFVTNDPNDRDHATLGTVAPILQLARRDLPAVASLALSAFAGAAPDGGTSLLRRAYELAVESSHEYLAELLDIALHETEHAAIA